MEEFVRFIVIVHECNVHTINLLVWGSLRLAPMMKTLTNKITTEISTFSHESNVSSDET